MKIIINEKQYDLLLNNKKTDEFSEQSEPVTPSPSSTTSSPSADSSTSYPQVGKWESGVTRGPSNQVGVTKWADVVGSTLKRGKANQLK